MNVSICISRVYLDFATAHNKIMKLYAGGGGRCPSMTRTELDDVFFVVYPYPLPSSVCLGASGHSAAPLAYQTHFLSPVTCCLCRRPGGSTAL